MIEHIEDDPINRGIMNYVQGYPEAKVAEIGDAVGLKRPAAQKRVNKLFSQGKLKRTIVVDLDALGFDNRFRIDIEVDPSELNTREGKKFLSPVKTATNIDNQQELLALQIMCLGTEDILVEDVSILLGDQGADLCLAVRGRDLRHVFDFVTKRLRSVPGIKKTHTYIEGWAVSRDFAAIRYLESLARKKATLGKGKSK